MKIQKSNKNQRKFYSEKKKRHMIKFEIITDLNEKILNISRIAKTTSEKDSAAQTRTKSLSVGGIKRT